MADIVGIAGLSIAIFDQLLKLGERTHQLISDIRAFDEDTKRIKDKLSSENNRNGLLRALLFSESNIYPTKTLFESFPEYIQEEIQLQLGESETVISEAAKILEKKYGNAAAAKSKDPLTPPPSGSTSRLRTSQRPWRMHSTSPIQLISWSMRGKKRVELVVTNFADLNAQMTEKVKLCSMALNSGIDLQGHRQRLRHDPTSKALGFDVDASLLGQVDSPGSSSPRRTWVETQMFREEVTDIVVLEENFSVAQWRAGTVLLEERHYQPDVYDATKLDGRAHEQTEMLAKLLQYPRESSFRIPPCLWWTHIPEEQRVVMAFSVDSPGAQYATSLHHLLGQDLRLSLNKKFVLAHSLARCLSQFQLVGWVHESIRSSNILFWSLDPARQDAKTLEETLDYSQPWVLGFEFSRPDVDCSIHTRDGFNIEREIYKHPDRQGLYMKRFTKIHDIYALGIVLLEIGVWETALTIGAKGIGDGRNPDVVKGYYIKQAERRLESKMGKKYKEVVLKCLKGNFGVNSAMDTQSELQLQQAFRRDVIDVLDKAQQSI